MGLLTQKDSTLFRGWFKEMAKLRGIHVLYQFPINMKFSKYAEEDPDGFSEPLEMDIIFDSNPKVSTLKRYGWVTETNEDKPYMAQLPFDAPKLEKGCRITIPAPFPMADEGLFVITDIKSNLEFPDSWAVKLAPVFKNKDNPENHNYFRDKNENFLKVEA